MSLFCSWFLDRGTHLEVGPWALRSVCLQTAYFPDDHTGELIAQGLKEALDSVNFVNPWGRTVVFLLIFIVKRKEKLV